MKKYIPRLVVIVFLLVLGIFLAVLLKSCFDTTVGRLDEDKIESLKGVS